MELKIRKKDGFWGFINTVTLGLSGYLIASVLGDSLVKTSENLAEATTRASQSVEHSAELLSETTREAIPVVCEATYTLKEAVEFADNANSWIEDVGDFFEALDPTNWFE